MSQRYAFDSQLEDIRKSREKAFREAEAAEMAQRRDALFRACDQLLAQLVLTRQEFYETYSGNVYLEKMEPLQSEFHQILSLADQCELEPAQQTILKNMQRLFVVLLNHHADGFEVMKNSLNLLMDELSAFTIELREKNICAIKKKNEDKEEREVQTQSIISRDEACDQNNHPFLLLPDDCHHRVFEHLGQQDVAKLGGVCKEFYRITRGRHLNFFNRLPPAALDYSQPSSSYESKLPLPTHGYAQHRLEPLSHGRLAIQQAQKVTILRVLHGSPIRIEWSKPIVQYFASLGKRFTVLSRDILAILPPHNMGNAVVLYDTNGNQIREIIANAGIREIYPLTGSRFIGLSHSNITIFDINQEEKQECIKTIPLVLGIHGVQFTCLTLSDNEFLFFVSTNTLKTYIYLVDLLSPIGSELVPLKPFPNLFCHHPVLLFNGMVCLSAGKSTDIVIFDPKNSYDKCWTKRVSKLHGVQSIVELSHNQIGVLLGDGTIHIYQIDMKKYDPFVHLTSLLPNPTPEPLVFGELAKLEDGRLLAIASNGTIQIHNFKYQVTQDKPEPRQDRCSIM